MDINSTNQNLINDCTATPAALWQPGNVPRVQLNKPSAPGPLTIRTINNLRGTFESRDHHPSPAMWKAIEDVASTIERMAKGEAGGNVYVSALAPGVGKTQTIIHALRALLKLPQYKHVGALVCLGRLEQIEEFIEEAQLPKDSYAVLVAQGNALNKKGLGEDRREEARILLTTHAQIELRCQRGRSFAEVSSLHYKGQPRAIRVHDEAFMHAQELTLTGDDILSIVGSMRVLSFDLGEALKCLETELNKIALAEDRATFVLPDLAAKFSIDLADALSVMDNASNSQRATVDALWSLFGRVVTVRRDEYRNGSTVLDYRERLPRDIAPLLVLDASARHGVREIYRLMEEHRGGIILLATADKDYSPLTIKVWDRGGGTASWRRNYNTLLEGVCRLIQSKPSERFLVVIHKKKGKLRIEDDIRKRLGPKAAEMVEFLTWGRHDSTNRFGHISNIILAGTHFYPDARYEALARAAAGKPSSEGSLDPCEIDKVRRGEHRHLILQAVSRGAVRKCVGNSCPPATVWVIASPKEGIRDELPAVFPGVTKNSIGTWEAMPPEPKEAKGKVANALKFIADRCWGGQNDEALISISGPPSVPFADVAGGRGTNLEALISTSAPLSVPFADVAKHVGCQRRDFNKRVLKHPAFIAGVTALGVTVCRERRVFMRMAEAHGFTVTPDNSPTNLNAQPQQP